VLCSLFHGFWSDQHESIDRADEVILARKGAKNRTHGRKSRSTGTKATTRVGPAINPRTDLGEELEACRRELAEARGHLSEALEQQTATSEVLRVISSSPGELELVFQAMLENATRICGAKFGVLWLAEADGFRSVAMHGLPPAHVEERQREPVIRPTPEDPLSRLARTKKVVHIADLKEDKAYIKGYPPLTMLKDNALVGAVAIYAQEVRPFTDKQIDLVSNFAAQAVIAIENTRLLNELREALDQQTATSEVLRVISSSPGELQPVFAAMLANAMRVCEAKFGLMQRYEGDTWKIAAAQGAPAYTEYLQQHYEHTQPGPETVSARITRTKQVVQTPDLEAARQ
jgi:hypothetical protein